MVEEFLLEIKEKVLTLLRRQLKNLKSLKVNLELFGYFVLESKGLEEIKSFNTRNEIVTLGTDLDVLYDNFCGILDEKVSEFQERESGWALKQLLSLVVAVNKYNPLRASSYLPLPSFIELKKAIVNVQNKDEYCFGWAILAGIVEPSAPTHRTSSYPDCRTFLALDGLEFPLKLRDIPKFEQLNPQLSVNVYGLESRFENRKMIWEVVGPLHYSVMKRLRHVNLLLLTNDEGDSHYCCIKKISRLVSQQITARNGAKHFCDGCLHYFRTEQHLRQHMKFDCNQVYTKIPTDELIVDKLGETIPQNILKFENYHKQLKAPFVVYADFETILKPVQEPDTQPDLESSFTVKTCEHVPYSFAYFIKCSYDDSLCKFQTYRGEDASTVFMERLDADVRYLYDIFLKNVVPLTTMTTAELQNYEAATSCHICDRPFVTDQIRVRDHCHLTGAYRGAAHSICNLNFKVPNFVPVFFHNLNYDSHLFVKQFAVDGEQIDVIPQTKEKYISFGKHLLVDEIDLGYKTQKVYLQIRFLDSYRFMNRSLRTLADYLADDQFFEIKRLFRDDAKFQLMRQKGVFPYSFVDSFEKLNLAKLPSKVQFFDSLHEEHVSQTDYDRAVSVWNTFDCQTLGDYSDIYLKADVLILADVFENFRKLCLEAYKFDPAQYYTDPGLSWDAMLRSTGVKLELLTDMDMIHFLKKSIRGGISTCIGRKAIANNCLVPNYDSSEPTSFIMYLDATNLYGFAMRQYLPHRNFEWLAAEEVENFGVSEIDDEADTGFILEVDLEYPELEMGA